MPSDRPDNPQGAGHRPISGLRAVSSLPSIRHIVAVGAGKGGVGKSSVAVNVAVGLARRGHAVGLLDGDIYGPSIPTMLGLHALEQVVHQGKLQPFLVHGVKAITIGKLVETDKPLIWRGPMAHGAFKQLTEQTDWGELDYLVIDLPPGTGDVSLTMAQMLKLTGAVVVCTPQKVAQDDAVRAAGMFRQLGIEVLGVVENMSYFVGDDGKVYDLFGRGGAEKMAGRLGVPFLGAVPITTALRVNSDSGDPSANFEGGTPLRNSLEQLVERLEKEVAVAAIRQGTSRPTLKVT
jgi:ATP-binding protein involved in chromosome partitioning